MSPTATKSSAEMVTAEAGEADSGTRLDRFLAKAVPQLSRTRLQALIRAGQLRQGGATISDPEYRVKQGERFELAVPPPQSPGLAPQPIPLRILYEDDQLLVIDKPAGLIVHPGAGNRDQTLVNALIAHCGESLSGIGGVARPGIVHRLDKDTSGLLVVAKTDVAHRDLAAQFADHGRTGDLERRYLALVWGAPSKPKGTISAAIGRHPTARTKMAVVDPDRPGARPAVTHYRLVERYGNRSDRSASPIASLVECTLETGRTHQVRLHLAHIGAPLIGDPLYARGFKSKTAALPPETAEAVNRLQRQALHAAGLRFRHPVSSALMDFTAPLAEDLDKLIVAFKEL